MQAPHIPTNEAERLASLRACEVLDTPSEPAFDALTELAAYIAGVPIALVSLIDADRQWFKSRYGLDAPETPRDVGFCGHVVASEEPLIVDDAFDDVRFADNPLVTGQPRVRFYAGMPLRMDDGFVLGTLCAIDHEPRHLSDTQIKLLGSIARQVVDQLELRRKNIVLAQSNTRLETYKRFFDLSVDPLCSADAELRIKELNPAWERVLGYDLDTLCALPTGELLHPEDREATLQEAARLREDPSITVSVTNRCRHRDGSWVSLAWLATIHDGTVFAGARDVTQFLREQETLRQSVAAASEANSRARGIHDCANYAIIETTPDGTIREFNAAAERMLGYRAQDIAGRETPALFHEPSEVADHAALLTAELGVAVEPGFEAFVAKARRGIPDENEWTYIHEDGTRVPVSLSITARRDDTNAIVGFIGIAADLTGRKHAESLLHASEERLGAMFESMGEGVVIHDAAGVIVDANPAAARILRVSRDELLDTAPDGSRWGTFRPDGSPFPPDEHPAAVVRRTAQPQLNVRMDLGEGEERTHLLINARPLTLVRATETHDAVLVTFRDVTHEVRIEEALRQSEARSRAVIEGAVDAIITVDEHGVIDRANNAVERLFGYSPSELGGQNIRRLLPSPDQGRHESVFWDGRATETAESSTMARDVTAARKDGSAFPAELSVSELFLNGRRFYSAVLRDVSDRKRVQRLQSEFVSTVSHELRTPLTSIRGALGLVAGGLLGELPPDAHEYIDIALSNSERLVRLINDILDIEKMDSENVEFRLRGVDLTGAVAACLASNEAYAAAHSVALVLLPGAPAGEVLVDPDRLTQALTNLISNAVKFSPAEKPVEVGIARRGPDLRVSVRDHGPGIPKEFQTRIFDRFAQADASSTRRKGGTGLGLSITKTIIENMRGSVGFEDAVGGGTRFFVDLPYLPPVEAVDPDDVEVASILVCEDNPVVSRLLQALLEGAGYRVHVAPTLERARRLLAAHQYDAITLDLVLADGSGTVLIDELRAADATVSLPIIVVSGSQHELGSAAVLVTDIIVKPFGGERLLEAVRGAIFDTPGNVPRLLHVEDDADIVRVVRRTLPAAWDVTNVGTVAAGVSALSSSSFDLVLLDLALPDGSGDELLSMVGRAQVIIFSAQDASAELSERVTAALVKSRATPMDVRDQIIALLANTRSKRDRKAP